MTNELKQQIVKAASDYMEDKCMSQNLLSQATKINVGYLSPMLKGDFFMNNTEISDKWFNQLADYIQFKIEKTYWPTQQTLQFMTVAAALQDAKEHPTAMILVGQTGAGKTYMIDKFCNQNPLHTYRLTVADHYRMKDIMTEICDLLNIPGVNMVVFDKLRMIRNKLLEIRRSGYTPVIIVDEAENLKVPALKMFKALYDQVNGYCSIVLIGTDDIVNKIENGCRKGVSGMPQFKRRFKAGIRYIPGIDVSFKQFLEPFDLENGLVKLLQGMATNYGELRDYLEPALREADKMGVPLTEDLFRRIYNMPKKQKGV